MSDQPQRAFSTAFKESVVLRLQAGERLAAVADELGIRRKLLYQWRHAYRRLGVAGLNRKRGPKPEGKGSGSPPGRASPAAPLFRRTARRSPRGQGANWRRPKRALRNWSG
jgi:transposase-like protein